MDDIVASPPPVAYPLAVRHLQQSSIHSSFPNPEATPRPTANGGNGSEPKEQVVCPKPTPKVPRKVPVPPRSSACKDVSFQGSENNNNGDCIILTPVAGGGESTDDDIQTSNEGGICSASGWPPQSAVSSRLECLQKRVHELNDLSSSVFSEIQAQSPHDAETSLTLQSNPRSTDLSLRRDYSGRSSPQSSSSSPKPPNSLPKPPLLQRNNVILTQPPSNSCDKSVAPQHIPRSGNSALPLTMEAPTGNPSPDDLVLVVSLPPFHCRGCADYHQASPHLSAGGGPFSCYSSSPVTPLYSNRSLSGDTPRLPQRLPHSPWPAEELYEDAGTDHRCVASSSRYNSSEDRCSKHEDYEDVDESRGCQHTQVLDILKSVNRKILTDAELPPAGFVAVSERAPPIFRQPPSIPIYNYSLSPDTEASINSSSIDPLNRRARKPHRQYSSDSSAVGDCGDKLWHGDWWRMLLALALAALSVPLCLLYPAIAARGENAPKWPLQDVQSDVSILIFISVATVCAEFFLSGFLSLWLPNPTTVAAFGLALRGLGLFILSVRSWTASTSSELFLYLAMISLGGELVATAVTSYFNAFCARRLANKAVTISLISSVRIGAAALIHAIIESPGSASSSLRPTVPGDLGNSANALFARIETELEDGITLNNLANAFAMLCIIGALMSLTLLRRRRFNESSFSSSDRFVFPPQRSTFHPDVGTQAAAAGGNCVGCSAGLSIDRQTTKPLLSTAVGLVLSAQVAPLIYIFSVTWIWILWSLFKLPLLPKWDPANDTLLPEYAARMIANRGGWSSASLVISAVLCLGLGLVATVAGPACLVFTQSILLISLALTSVLSSTLTIVGLPFLISSLSNSYLFLYASIFSPSLPGSRALKVRTIAVVLITASIGVFASYPLVSISESLKAHRRTNAGNYNGGGSWETSSDPGVVFPEAEPWEVHLILTTLAALTFPAALIHLHNVRAQKKKKEILANAAAIRTKTVGAEAPSVSTISF